MNRAFGALRGEESQAVTVLFLAHDVATSRQLAQARGGHSAGWPAVSAILLALRRVDAPEAIDDAVLLDGVAVGDCLGSRWLI
jgi:hypothetical protein